CCVLTEILGSSPRMTATGPRMTIRGRPCPHNGWETLRAITVRMRLAPGERGAHDIVERLISGAPTGGARAIRRGHQDRRISESPLGDLMWHKTAGNSFHRFNDLQNRMTRTAA